MCDRNTSVPFTGATLKVDPVVSDTVKVVKTPYDMAGVLDSGTVYLIDSVIDFTDSKVLPLDVPVGGLIITGHGPDISQMLSTEDGAVLFQSLSAGNFNATNVSFSVTGAGARVYDLEAATGNEAHEISRVNYVDCDSLGELDSYRQGFESNTGRFGGTPALTLTGVWAGGFFIDAMITRSLIDGAYSLFTAGAGLQFASRFRSTANVDLPALASYIDFAPSAFASANLLQLVDGIVTRDGVADPEDANLLPNMANADLESFWKGNVGLRNTHVGGAVTSSGTAVTTITAIGALVDLNATWTLSNAEHFDNPAGSQIRHLASSPQEFKVTAVVSVSGTAGRIIELSIVKTSLSGDTVVVAQQREVVNLVGPNDIALFNAVASTTLGEDEYLRLRIANLTDTSNVTCLVDSILLIEER